MRPAARASAVQHAFDAVFEAHHRALLAYALRRTLAAADAEDAVSETFAIAWRKFELIPDEPLPWLYGVCRRVLANQRRGNLRRAGLLERLTAFRSDVTDRPSPEPAIEALERLAPGDRELLRLVAWEELTHAEIGSVLGITPNAVAIRLHRARRRFADALAAVKTAELKGTEPSRTSPSVKGRVAGMWGRGSAR